jgi:hypothetical protein
MTDFRALCVELTDCLEKSDWPHRYKPVFEQWIYIARKALAEPEPEVPTRRQLMMLADEMGMASVGDSAEYARAVLARWGNHPEFPDRSPQPFPVGEYLPGSEDCNSEGEVWAWRRFDFEGDMDNGDFWCLAYHEWLEDEDCGFTHWLPAHALPVPSHD